MESKRLYSETESGSQENEYVAAVSLSHFTCKRKLCFHFPSGTSIDVLYSYVQDQTYVLKSH